MKNFMMTSLMALLFCGVSHASTDEQRLNCYSNAVIEIWEQYDAGKTISPSQVIKNLVASGAITYNFEMETIISVNTLKNPAELLGLSSENKGLATWQADKFSQSIPTASVAVPYLSKRIKAGLYREIRNLESCNEVF